MKTNISEKKSVKTLKGQLFGAISMMLVAAIALGTSTYAWFINNSAVTVDTMNLTVSTSTSLLVAIGKKDSITPATGAIANWTSYKSTITNADITGGGTPGATDPADWTNFFNHPLTPASATSANLLVLDAKFFMSNNHVSESKLDEFTRLTFGDDASTVGSGVVKRLPLKFTASNDMKVYFDSDKLTASIANMVKATANAPAVGTADADAQATAIKKALRVAVVPASKSGSEAVDGAKVFQFDAGNTTTDTNNTHYNGQTGVVANEGTGIYSAIATLESTVSTGGGFKIATVGQLNTLIPSSADASKNGDKTLATVIDGIYSAPGTDPTPLFDLTANTERRVDVYIWLEGTDRDCLNELSAYNFSLDIPFCAVLTTVTP